MQTKTALPFFELPKRQTPTWEQVNTVQIKNKETLIKVITGQLPIGLLPFEIISEDERVRLVKEVKNLQSKQYDGTDETEKVYTKGGLPFVNFSTLAEFLAAVPDPEFERITQPILERLLVWLRTFGFGVEPLTDSVTLQQYHNKVCRHIAVDENCLKIDGGQCTVLHCDDILRDGSKKPDFRNPIGLEEGQAYYQGSICILFENGGFRPDALYVHEKQYSGEMESEFNDWRAPQSSIKDKRSLSYVPQLREGYMFSTLNLHDVRGGDVRAERLTFSIFIIYVPDTNTLYYYN
jgi:hypothetical protein